MGLLDKKYKELQPTKNYLTDKIVLAQAWKKAHQYIRSTNWYADTFELDRSAIDLDSLLDKWIDELLQDDFHFNPLRIVSKRVLRVLITYRNGLFRVNIRLDYNILIDFRVNNILLLMKSSMHSPGGHISY